MRASIAFSASDNDGDNDDDNNNKNDNNHDDDYQFLENYRDHTYLIQRPTVAAPFSISDDRNNDNFDDSNSNGDDNGDDDDDNGDVEDNDTLRANSAVSK
jgi:hypothetical protein